MRYPNWEAGPAWTTGFHCLHMHIFISATDHLITHTALLDHHQIKILNCTSNCITSQPHFLLYPCLSTANLFSIFTIIFQQLLYIYTQYVSSSSWRFSLDFTPLQSIQGNGHKTQWFVLSECSSRLRYGNATLYLIIHLLKDPWISRFWLLRVKLLVTLMLKVSWAFLVAQW